MACKNKQKEESDFLNWVYCSFHSDVAKDFFKSQEKSCRANCQLPTIYFYKFGIPCG